VSSLAPRGHGVLIGVERAMRTGARVGCVEPASFNGTRLRPACPHGMTGCTPGLPAMSTVKEQASMAALVKSL
jgi:hypothetical protein